MTPEASSGCCRLPLSPWEVAAPLRCCRARRARPWPRLQRADRVTSPLRPPPAASAAAQPPPRARALAAAAAGSTRAWPPSWGGTS